MTYPRARTAFVTAGVAIVVAIAAGLIVSHLDSGPDLQILTSDDGYALGTVPTYAGGTEARLVAGSGGGHVAITYLKFRVGALPGGVAPRRAEVRLTRSAGALPPHVELTSVPSNRWGEGQLTSTVAPRLGTVLGSARPDPLDGTLTFDVTRVIRTIGTYSFAVTAPAGEGLATFIAKEADRTRQKYLQPALWLSAAGRPQPNDRTARPPAGAPGGQQQVDLPLTPSADPTGSPVPTWWPTPTAGPTPAGPIPPASEAPPASAAPTTGPEPPVEPVPPTTGPEPPVEPVPPTTGPTPPASEAPPTDGPEPTIGPGPPLPPAPPTAPAPTVPPIPTEPPTPSGPVTPTASAAPSGSPEPEPEPRCAVGERLVPTCGVLWGVAPGAHTSQPRDEALRDFEAKTGRPQAIYHAYHRGTDIFPTPAEIAIARRPEDRRLLFLNWKPRASSWSAIANGDPETDAYLDRLARHIRENFPEPFFFTVHHEPENDVRPVPGSGWTAKDYAAMYRYVIQRLRAGGVTNLVSVIAYMAYVPWNTKSWFQDLYPGDDVVDWIGWDTYAYSVPGYGHGDFAEMLNRRSSSRPSWPGFYNWAAFTFPDKPLMVAEWGVWHAPANAGHAPWFYDTVGQQIQLFPRVKALVYFDTPNNQQGWDSRVDVTPQALGAYRRLGLDRVFQVEMD